MKQNGWRRRHIGDNCPFPGCSGHCEIHDPGGQESHQLRCDVHPSTHLIQIGADRYCQLKQENGGQTTSR